MNNDNKRSWTTLCWNIRGINSEGKWTAIKSKIFESNCDIIYLQETKRESFELQYIKNYYPGHFDSFEFLPSVWASGGSIIIWKSSKLIGHLIFQNNFAQFVEFTCQFSGEYGILTNIYAPCTAAGKI